MFVDELRMTVAAKQHAKVVEPSHHTLELHAVDQEYSQWDFVLPHKIEESVLQVLCSFSCHFFSPFCQSRRAATSVEDFFINQAVSPEPAFRPNPVESKS